MLILMIALVGIAAWSQSSSALSSLSDAMAKTELAGITGFYVSVSVSPDSLTSLLPISSIQTDVELKLRIARIPVLPLSQAASAVAHGAMIEVSVDGVRAIERSVWAINLRVECLQTASLDRNPHVSTMGITWWDGTIAVYGDYVVPDFREVIKDKIDKFLNLYLSANP